MPELKIKIGADSKGLKKGTKEAESTLKSFAKKIDGLFGNPFAKLAGALAVGSLISKTKELIDRLDGIGAAAKRMGVSSNEFLKLKYAAEQSDSSIENVADGFKTLQKAITDASTRGGESALMFSDIGVSLSDLSKMAPEEQFKTILRSISQIDDLAAKGAIAEKLFGGSGTSLLALADDVDSLYEKFDSFSTLIDGKAIDAASRLNDSLGDLRLSIDEMVANSGFVPWLADVADGLNAVSKNGSDMQKAQHPDIKVTEDNSKIPAWKNVASFLTAGLYTPDGEDVLTSSAPSKAEIDSKRKQNTEKQDRIKSVNDALNASKKKLIDNNVNNELGKFFGPIDKQSLKLREDEAKKTKEVKEAIDDQIKAMKQAIEIQRLKNAGLNLEAAIKEEINKAEDTAKKDGGRSLSPDERMQITDFAKKQYWENNSIDLPELKQEPTYSEQTFAGSLTSIGGGPAGKMFGFANPQQDIVKKIDASNKLLKDIAKNTQTPVVIDTTNTF